MDLDLESKPDVVALLPPLDPGKQGTIFLDLDDTLTHTSHDYPENWYDFMVKNKIDGRKMYLFVSKRREWIGFSKKMSKKFELVIFTAGENDYASMVLDVLDPKGRISHRLYRDSFLAVNGTHLKDLAATGRDLRKSVIIDDNPNAYSLQPENGIPIKPFVDNVKGRELEKLERFFEGLDELDDLRKAVALYRDRGAGPWWRP